MEILSVVKGSKVTMDSLMSAFRGMVRNGSDKVEISGVVFCLNNPVENIWFVHAYRDGVQVAAAKFDQFDL